MAARAEEAYGERDQTVNADGDVIEVGIPYIVFGAADEGEALAAGRSSAAEAHIAGMSLATVEVTERLNDSTWKVKAVFEESDSGSDDGGGEEDSTSFAFDTGGGSMHRNQSLATVARYPSGAPDFHGAIEVDNEGNVNGVDVTMPVLNFTETHVLAASAVTTAYKRKVAATTGTVNSSGFRGFEAGEVLFLGASGTKRSKRSDSPWEITFRFAVSANQSSFRVGDITVSQKKGWDYLWVRYADRVSDDSRNMIKKPVAAYVERVYPAGNFGDLGIGG